MYHENKTNDVTHALLSNSISYYAIFVGPWPFVFWQRVYEKTSCMEDGIIFSLLEFMGIDI
jgi:hypothetical protein